MKRVQVVKRFKKNLLCVAIAATLGGSITQTYAVGGDPKPADQAELVKQIENNAFNVYEVIQKLKDKIGAEPALPPGASQADQDARDARIRSMQDPLDVLVRNRDDMNATKMDLVNQYPELVNYLHEIKVPVDRNSHQDYVNSIIDKYAVLTGNTAPDDKDALAVYLRDDYMGDMLGLQQHVALLVVALSEGGTYARIPGKVIKLDGIFRAKHGGLPGVDANEPIYSVKMETHVPKSMGGASVQVVSGVDHSKVKADEFVTKTPVAGGGTVDKRKNVELKGYKNLVKDIVDLANQDGAGKHFQAGTINQALDLSTPRTIRFLGDELVLSGGGSSENDAKEVLSAIKGSADSSTVHPKGRLSLKDGHKLAVEKLGGDGEYLEFVSVDGKSALKADEVRALATEVSGSASGLDKDAKTPVVIYAPKGAGNVYGAADSNPRGDIVLDAKHQLVKRAEADEEGGVDDVNEGVYYVAEIDGDNVKIKVDGGKAVKADGVFRAQKSVALLGDAGVRRITLGKDAQSGDFDSVVVKGKGGFIHWDQTKHGEQVNLKDLDVQSGDLIIEVADKDTTAAFNLSKVSLVNEGVVKTEYTEKDAKTGKDVKKSGFVILNLAEIAEIKEEDLSKDTDNITYHQGELRIAAGRTAYLLVNGGTKGADDKNFDGKIVVEGAHHVGAFMNHQKLTVGKEGVVQAMIATVDGDRDDQKGVKNFFEDGSTYAGGWINGDTEYSGTVTFKPDVVKNDLFDKAADVFALAMPAGKSIEKDKAIPIQLTGTHVVKEGATLLINDSNVSMPDGTGGVVTLTKEGDVDGNLIFKDGSRLGFSTAKDLALLKLAEGGKVDIGKGVALSGDLRFTEDELKQAKKDGKFDLKDRAALFAADPKDTMERVIIDYKDAGDDAVTGEFEGKGKSIFFNVDISPVKEQKLVAKVSRATNAQVEANLRRDGAKGVNAKALAVHARTVTANVNDKNSVISAAQVAAAYEIQKAVDAGPGAVARLAQEDTPQNLVNGGNVMASRALVQHAHGNVEQRLNGHNDNVSMVSAGDPFESQGFWGRYIYSDGKQDNKDDIAGYDIKLNGITLGLDAAVNEQLTVGFAFTYAKADVDVKDVSQSTKGDNYMGTFYAGWTEGPWFMDGLLSYGVGKNDYKSQIAGASYKGDGDTNTWAFTFGGGYNMPLNEEWTLQPKAEFNFVNVSVDDYKLKNDSTGAFNSKVKADDFQVTELGIGVRLIGDIALEQGTLMPEFRLMGYYDFSDKKYQGDYESLLPPPAVPVSEKLEGLKREKGRGLAGLGVTYAVDTNLSFGLDYDYNFSGDYKAHSIMAKVSYDF